MHKKQGQKIPSIMTAKAQETRPGPHRTILAIAVPAILANSSTPLVGLVDTWAVGHLPGAMHLAAVGLGSVVFSYLFWAFGFLRMGTTGLVAQALGRDDTRGLDAEVIRACAVGLAIGLLLLLLQQPLLEISLAAMAPPPEVGNLMAAYFRIRIWSAPAVLSTFALAGVLYGLARTGAYSPFIWCSTSPTRS
jgi:MATE family multidrug resistance protein